MNSSLLNTIWTNEFYRSERGTISRGIFANVIILTVANVSFTRVISKESIDRENRIPSIYVTISIRRNLAPRSKLLNLYSPREFSGGDRVSRVRTKKKKRERLVETSKRASRYTCNFSYSTYVRLLGNYSSYLFFYEYSEIFSYIKYYNLIYFIIRNSSSRIVFKKRRKNYVVMKL